jgi:hypothetical protein
MSCTEYKTVIRAEIPVLNGKGMTEAYAYFQPILGEADYLDEWDGEVEYFQYEEMKNDFVPVFEYSYGKTDNKRIGVDYILSYSNDYGSSKGKTNFSFEELAKLAEVIAEKFDIDPKKCRLVSYSWYNGGDEPVEFE